MVGNSFKILDTYENESIWDLPGFCGGGDTGSGWYITSCISLLDDNGKS